VRKREERTTKYTKNTKNTKKEKRIQKFNHEEEKRVKTEESFFATKTRRHKGRKEGYRNLTTDCTDYTD